MMRSRRSLRMKSTSRRSRGIGSLRGWWWSMGLGVWQPGCLAVWESGRMGVWQFGNFAVWTAGCLGG